MYVLIIRYDNICVKLMVTGVGGRDGPAAPRHVDLEKEADQETATTQLQLMEAETVRDQAWSLELVTKILVQVSNVCLIPLDICTCLS